MTIIRVLAFLLLMMIVPQAQAAGPESKFAQVGAFNVHYLIAGKGDVIVLLHGYGQSSRMWLPLIKELQKTHTVIAPDLRGAGQTDAPEEGYTKSIMARDVYNLLEGLGYNGKIQIVGHDIGLMVAYAYASLFPNKVERIALMDAFLPGVGNWQKVWLLRDLWHFHFFGPTPEALVKGRERIYLDHFWNDFAANPKKSIPAADRDFYTKQYAKPGHIRAGMAYFSSFPQDAAEFADFSATKLTIPMLVLSGERAGGQFLIEQGKMVAENVKGVVIEGAGHWLMEEAPDQVIPALVEFLNQKE